MNNQIRRRDMILCVLAPIFCLLLGTSRTAADHQNFLEIYVSKTDGHYEILFEFGKPGATTCDLSTPQGDYSFDCPDGTWLPGQDFLDDHSNMAFAELSAVIEQPWILIWDQGFAEEVTVTIDFGVIAEDEFPGEPTLLYPEDGAVYVRPDPNPITVDWTYAQDPCEAQPDEVIVVMHGPEGVELIGEEVTEYDCNITEWTPPVPLAEGLWDVTIINLIAARDIPVGLSVDPPGGWEFDNFDWLDLEAPTGADFAVPVDRKSLGAIKSMFR